MTLHDSATDSPCCWHWLHRKMLQVSSYSLVLSVQFIILIFDLLANSFAELLLIETVVPLIIFIIQDIGILFNIIIIFLMFFNTFVFQAGLVKLLIHRFTGTIIISGIYFFLSVSFHVWIQNLRWRYRHRFVWTNGLQVLFVFQRFVAMLYYYSYKRTTLCLGDPRLYEDSEWLRNEFFRVRKWVGRVLQYSKLKIEYLTCSRFGLNIEHI